MKKTIDGKLTNYRLGEFFGIVAVATIAAKGCRHAIKEQSITYLPSLMFGRYYDGNIKKRTAWIIVTKKIILLFVRVHTPTAWLKSLVKWQHKNPLQTGLNR